MVVTYREWDDDAVTLAAAAYREHQPGADGACRACGAQDCPVRFRAAWLFHLLGEDLPADVPAAPWPPESGRPTELSPGQFYRLLPHPPSPVQGAAGDAPAHRPWVRRQGRGRAVAGGDPHAAGHIHTRPPGLRRTDVRRPGRR